jgi:hypothetical protein
LGDDYDRIPHVTFTKTPKVSIMQVPDIQEKLKSKLFDESENEE